MPVSKSYATRLGEGGTPYRKAERLAEAVGISNLYLKDETQNPTASFKDRAMAVGVAKAREARIKTVVTASSGNAAASLAAYSASSGIRCIAFVLDTASEAKLAQLALYGAYVIRVSGIEEGEDPTVKMMLETVRRKGWYPCPSFGPFNPYQVEGPKSISYELAEDWDWRPEGFVFVPTGSSCLLTGLWKGFKDLMHLDFIKSAPGLVPVQPAGNSPLIRAIDQKLKFEQIKAEPNPSTVASGLSDPYPWDGDASLEAVEQTHGFGVSAPDPDIIQAVKDLAKYEGLMAEPSGAAGLAGLRIALRDGKISKNDPCTVLVTGSGLKDISTLASLAPQPPLVGSDLSQLDQVLSHLGSV